jgi:hypothetical protein
MSETADNASLAGVRIGILHHAGSRLLRRGYLIELMADEWAARGAEVVDIVGIETAVPVDVLLLHVDLSIVPDEYLHFAKSYSSVINLEAVDIRKTSYLDDLVGAESDWDGPVIVKSNFNPAGWGASPDSAPDGSSKRDSSKGRLRGVSRSSFDSGTKIP